MSVSTSPSFLGLLLTYTKIGLAVGTQKHAYLYDAFVRRRALIAESDYLEGFALSNLLPGPNMVNLAIACGLRLQGKRLAILGTLALVLPGTVIIALVAVFATSAADDPLVAAALRGMMAGACAVVVITFWRMARGSLSGVLDVALAAACCGAMIAGVPLLVALPAFGVVSFVLHPAKAAA